MGMFSSLLGGGGLNRVIAAAPAADSGFNHAISNLVAAAPQPQQQPTPQLPNPIPLLGGGGFGQSLIGGVNRVVAAPQQQPIDNPMGWLGGGVPNAYSYFGQ